MYSMHKTVCARYAPPATRTIECRAPTNETNYATYYNLLVDISL